MYQKTLTHRISKFITDLLFFLSIFCIIAVPFSADFLFGEERSAAYTTGFSAILISSGICSAYILFNLRKMYRTLLVGNPFNEENIIRFRNMAVSCALISFIYLIKCFFIFSFGTVVVTLVFVVGCLFCLTLKDLFKQAVNYKTENELTI